MNTQNMLKRIVSELQKLDTPRLMALATETGLSYSTLYRLRRDPTNDPRLSVFEILRKKFRITSG